MHYKVKWELEQTAKFNTMEYKVNLTCDQQAEMSEYRSKLVALLDAPEGAKLVLPQKPSWANKY